ncbi:sulfite exporter TauE/SafE family protein [Candidatus Woesearchaeota archaeon]|nr:sulfite exporter TauE/SafE family protein [Candidatus Woesearchaeota archaeon]
MKKEFKIEGMTCPSCEKIISRAVMKLDGVHSVEVDYKKGWATLSYDEHIIDFDTILDRIEDKGYEVLIKDEDQHKQYPEHMKKPIGLVMAILGALVFGYFIIRFADGSAIPEFSDNMSYALLLLAGLLTGFHCVAMCGGFVVSYTTKAAQDNKPAYLGHMLYGSGKLISYTVIGALFGLLGMFIAFTPFMRGVAGILAGTFLILFGLHMFGLVKWFRNFQLRTPAFLAKIIHRKSKESTSPFIIGLLNGLMIVCGPLQAVYIMAAGTGSVIEGAKLLFIFGIGTLPVMLGFGYMTSFLSGKLTHKILKASGVVVIILGIIMLNRGLALTGTGYDITTVMAAQNGPDKITGQVIKLEDGYQVIEMDVLASGWSPNKFVLQKDIPVKWKINGKQITGCNRAIQVPDYNLNFDIKEGMQTIEFTPTEEGVISWSCWMGMIPGTFIVQSDTTDTAQLQQAIAEAPAQNSGSCSMGCGCGQ